MLPARVAELPAELLACRQWVGWGFVWREPSHARAGGWAKQALDPRNGAPADCRDPATWGAWAEVAGLERIGFVVTEHDPYCVLDVDGGWDAAAAAPLPWARAIVDRIPTYWEVSPGGAGMRGLVRATPPRNRVIRLGGGMVEIFSRDRFATLTGHRLAGTPPVIADRRGAVLAVLYPDLTREAP